MVDIGVLIALFVAVGAFGGFISSLMKWLETTESFETRKNVKGIITGLVSGLVLGIAAISSISDNMTSQAIAVAIGTVFLGAVGVDKLTSNVSGMVSKKQPTEKTSSAPL
jgi:uncharacterized protein YacL